MVDTDVVVTDEIGFALRMIDMTILGIYYAIIQGLTRQKLPTKATYFGKF